MRFPAKIFLPVAISLATTIFAAARESPSVVVGDVRVQVLSDTLVRLEVRGAKGFEDRVTFHVINRDWPGAKFSVTTNAGVVEVRAVNFTTKISSAAKSLADVTVVSPAGAELYRYDGKLENSKWLPSPGDRPQAWWFADAPRMIPAKQGLTPSLNGAPDAGWDLGNDAADVYVFLPRGDYRQLRQDFLRLTGPSEMPPLFLFGAFDSRWYDYSEATALKQVDDYRSRKIPLDVLVVDTGWRAGASTGYQPNTNLLPDLPRFFAEAHAKNVKILFNDHPEPLDTNRPALDARELDFRFNGLANLLRQGLDIWWYDRNWWVALVSPAPNLRKEVWGMRLYHDTTERVNPDLRPLIMANVDGIDNGIRKRPMNVASHRFTFQWSGDINPTFDYLRRGVENAVQAGVNSAFPYMSEDLGGHMANPTTELYIRWLEYGALSPVYRPHCTHNLERMPWAFGAEVERIARNYLNMRYRLLPVFYAACRENFETGEPLLQRLDLEFPDLADAKREDEYLLGKDILVAPVVESATASQAVKSDFARELWLPPGEWIDAWTGERLTGPRQFTKNCPLDQIPLFVRDGAVLALAPEMQFTAEKLWSPVTLDLYPRVGATNSTTLYEDDAHTTAYRHGEFRKTKITASADDVHKVVTVKIGAAKGNFSGALKQREWILRVRRPAGWPESFTPAQVKVDRKIIGKLLRLARDAAVMPFGDKVGAPDQDVFEIMLPLSRVTAGQVIEILFSHP